MDLCVDGKYDEQFQVVCRTFKLSTWPQKVTTQSISRFPESTIYTHELITANSLKQYVRELAFNLCKYYTSTSAANIKYLLCRQRRLKVEYTRRSSSFQSNNVWTWNPSRVSLHSKNSSCMTELHQLPWRGILSSLQYPAFIRLSPTWQMKWKFTERANLCEYLTFNPQFTAC